MNKDMLLNILVILFTIDILAIPFIILFSPEYIHDSLTVLWLSLTGIITATLIDKNKQLKELISTILNWNIFKNECPMNFGYDENTIEDKSQEVFYQDDDYCENNCNGDYQKCWLKYFKKMQELEKGDSNE